MSFSTVYDVKVRYSVDNRAGQAVGGLVQETRALGAEARSTSSDFMKMGHVIVGVFAGHEAKKALIDFNSGVENAKISLSAMIQGNRGGTWERASEQAGKLYDEFQAFSQTTPVTTQQMLEFGRGVAVATFQAGGGIKDLTTITEMGTVAAKTLGYESSYAALELTEMLQGNVTKRMRFAQQLLGMAHSSEEEFKKLNSDQRRELVEKVLTSEAMRNANAGMAGSWSGITSTFEDRMQITLGKVGLPLFTAIKMEIKGWSDWMEQNKRRVEEIGQTLGGGLATGFGVLKDGIMFLVSHAGTLMQLGKLWLAVRIGGLATNLMSGIGSAGGVAGGMFGAGGFFRRGKAASDSIDPFTGEYKYTPSVAPGRGMATVGMGNIAGNIPLLAQSAAVGYAIGTIINETTGLKEALHNLAIGEMGREFEKVNKAADALTESLNRAADAHKGPAAVTNLVGAGENLMQQANVVRDMLRAKDAMDMTPESIERFAAARKAMDSMGIGDDDFKHYGGASAFADAMAQRSGQLQGQSVALGIGGTVAWELGIRELTDYQRQTLDTAKAQQDLLTYINMSLAKGVAIAPKTVMDILRRDTDDPEGKHKKLADKPNVNIHIARIEVQSDDPDRIAFGLIESFRDAAKNPSGALAALREG